MTADRTPSGFTLIELLVVIAILGLLAVVFLPEVIGATESGEITETESRMILLKTEADRYQREYNAYPADDFQDPTGELELAPDNGTNTGIESLVVFVGQRRNSSLADQPEWLMNTDSDENGAEIPALSRTDRPEVLDAWGTPFAYFCAWTGGMAKEQRIQAPDGTTLKVRAWKNPRTDALLGGRKYQLVSAGPDLVFNTDDDITWPDRPAPEPQ